MNSQNFVLSTQALNERLENISTEDIFADCDEVPATQSSESDEHSQAETVKEIKSKFDFPSYQEREKSFPSQQIEEQILTQIEEEPSSQNVIRKMPTIVSRPIVKLPPKKLTNEEIQTREEFIKGLVVPLDVDYSLYNPEFNSQKPKDEMPAELRSLLSTKTFVSAKEVQCIMSQSQTQPNTARSLAEAIMADFEDIDNDTLTQIEHEHILNYSLGSLTQKLNTSVRAAELFENSLSQNEPVDLDVTRIDLDAFPSDNEDDDDIQCTDELEFDFICATENISSPEQSQTMLNKPLEDEQMPSCSKDVNQTCSRFSSGIGQTWYSSGVSLTANKTERKTDSFIDDKSKSPALPPIKLPGFSLATGRSMNIDPESIKRFKSAFEEEDLKITSKLIEDENETSFKTPVAAKTFKMPTSITSSSSRSDRFINSTSFMSTPASSKPQSRLNKLKEEFAREAKPLMTGFSSAAGKSLKLNDNELKKIAASFEKEDKLYAQELEDEAKEHKIVTTPEKHKAKKIRLNFDSPDPTNTDLRLNNVNQKSRNESRLAQISDSQEVSSIVQLCVSMDDMTQEYFKIPDSPAMSISGLSRIKNSSALETSTTSSSTLETSRPQTRSTKRFKESSELHPQGNILPGFASAGGNKLKMDQDHLKKLMESFNKEDKRIVDELVEDFDVSVSSPKSKKPRLSFDASPISSTSLVDRDDQQYTTSRSTKMTDSQEVSSIIQLCESLEASQDCFKIPDSTSLSTKSPAVIKTKKMASHLTLFSATSEPSRPRTRLSKNVELESVHGSSKKKLSVKVCAIKNAGNFQKIDQQIGQDSKEEVNDDCSFNTPEKPRFRKHQMDFDDSPVPSSPFMMNSFQKGINQHSTPLLKSTVKSLHEKVLDNHELSTINEQCESMEDALEELDSSPKKKKSTKVRLLSKFNESSESDLSLDLSVIDSIEQQYKAICMIDDEVKLARKRALEEQRKSIKDKPEANRAQKEGTVFIEKRCRNRQKVIDYVENQQPKNLNRHQITMNNALDYKFIMQNFFSETVCTTNTDGILIADDARLVFNEESKVGIEEVKWSFLSSPGVDPKLVSERWIENAFKMILFKLASLENSFEKFDKFELLTPENLLMQMKYRYDREVDRNHRSAIKKIVELDDVPCRRMVLKVVDVINSTMGCELVLSDGWYSIYTTIDANLADAVDRQKVKVGTKLIISLAELIGCHGCDPLEMPGNVRLKIYANSTRRTDWNVKVGFTQNPTALRVPLDSVLATGVIGKLTVVVTHVYQTIYVDSSNEKKEFRSEKLQHRIQNMQEILNFAVYEQVAYQVQQEEMKELGARVISLRTPLMKIENLRPDQICDLLDFESDADETKFILDRVSCKTMERVQTVRNERVQDFNAKIRAKLGERNKNLSQLLRFRVVDAINPGKTALVSWWSPSEEIKETIQEGKAFEIVNSNAAPFINQIQVIAGKSSVVKLMQLRVPSEKFGKYFRKETKISEINVDFKPQHDEFDVGCIVVQIDPAYQGLQKVYVADEDINVLCINFWSSLSENAFDDVVTCGRILYARNLQWRSSHASDKIPQAFVISESTLFIPNPKDEIQKARLTELNESIEDKTKFLKTCNEKIAALQSGKNVPLVNKENERKSINNVAVKQVKPAPLGRPDFSKSFESFPRKSQRSSIEVKSRPRRGQLGASLSRSFAPIELKSKTSTNSRTAKSKTR